MNILYVQAGQAVGGSKESLYQILRSLPDEFARQVVLERGSDPGFNERARRYASAVHLLPLPTWQQYRRRTLAERARAPLADAWRLLRCALAAFKIARVIRQERIDLVHTNNSMSPSGALAARLTATPHIWHVRESIGKHKQYPLLLGNLALRLMRRWSDTVICNSDYTAEVFREMRIPVRVIPNGLDLADFAPDAGTPRELGSLADLPPGEKRVGMVGNLTTKMKRHDVFLDIAALVKAAAPRTRFIVFGGSADLEQTEYTRALRQKAEALGLAENLTWAGFEKDIPAMMRSLDVLIHPALTEGSGRVVMEAMASGVPVIAFRSGGVKELIDDGVNGYLVEPGQPARAAEIALRLLRDSNTRAIIGAAARAHAQRCFGAQTMIDSLKEAYQSAVRKK